MWEGEAVLSGPSVEMRERGPLWPPSVRPRLIDRWGAALDVAMARDPNTGWRVNGAAWAMIAGDPGHRTHIAVVGPGSVLDRARSYGGGGGNVVRALLEALLADTGTSAVAGGAQGCDDRVREDRIRGRVCPVARRSSRGRAADEQGARLRDNGGPGDPTRPSAQ